MFKDWMKRKYENIMSFFSLGERKKPKIKREQILNFISENWYDDNRIKTDIIIKAF